MPTSVIDQKDFVLHISNFNYWLGHKVMLIAVSRLVRLSSPPWGRGLWLDCVAVCLSNSQSVCPSVCLAVSLSVCLSGCQSVCQSVRLSVSLSVWQSVCQSACLSLILSVYLSVYLSVSLFLYSKKWRAHAYGIENNIRGYIGINTEWNKGVRLWRFSQLVWNTPTQARTD